MRKSTLYWLCLTSLIALVVIGCDQSRTSTEGTIPVNVDDNFELQRLTEPAKQESESITLSPDEVYGGSLKTVTAEVKIDTEMTKDGLKFWMTRSDPQAGDFSAIRFPVDNLTVGQGYELTINLVNPYAKTKNVTYLQYEVLMDDNMLLTEDAALSSGPNIIKILWNAEKPEASFTIQMVALKNCPPYEWGKFASPIIVKNVTMKPVPSVEMLKVTASSSSSKIL